MMTTNNIKELYGNKSLYLIKNINHSGKIDLEFGKFQKAKEKFLNALNIIKENTKDKDKDISSNSRGLIRYSSYDYLLTLSNLGFVNNILGDHIESEKFYIKAIEVFKSYKVRNSDNDLYSTYPHLLNSIYLDIYAKLLNNLEVSTLI